MYLFVVDALLASFAAASRLAKVMSKHFPPKRGTMPLISPEYSGSDLASFSTSMVWMSLSTIRQTVLWWAKWACGLLSTITWSDHVMQKHAQPYSLPVLTDMRRVLSRWGTLQEHNQSRRKNISNRKTRQIEKLFWLSAKTREYFFFLINFIVQHHFSYLTMIGN